MVVTSTSPQTPVISLHLHNGNVPEGEPIRVSKALSPS